MNGDGKPDLISANINANTLTVLTNNGSGGFVIASSPGVGSGPYSVTAADVNGDGKPDLISANVNASTLTVLTNNGSSGFVVASSPGVGLNPYSVTAADVNGDGKPDLISANFNANTLTVLFNTTTFTGKFAGDGSGLTGLNAANLTGTVADAALSANVALRAGGNAFTGNQSVTSGNVGIGTNSPQRTFHVVSTSQPALFENPYGFFSVDGFGPFNGTTLIGTFAGKTNLAPRLRFSGPGSSWIDIGQNTNADFVVDGSDIPRFVVQNGGNVGIGTTTPASSLEVNGSTTTRGFNIVSVTTNAPTAAATLTATSGYVVLNPAAAVTLNATTAIAAGSTPGQMLILRGNSDVNTVTINDNAGTALVANRVLGLNDILSLVWTGSVWAEISFANN